MVVTCPGSPPHRGQDQRGEEEGRGGPQGPGSLAGSGVRISPLAVGDMTDAEEGAERGGEGAEDPENCLVHSCREKALILFLPKRQFKKKKKSKKTPQN